MRPDKVIDMRVAAQAIAKKRCFVRVNHEGEIVYNRPCSTTDLYDATLVIVKRNGKLYVFKDRYGMNGVYVTEDEARTLAKSRASSRAKVLR